MLHADPAARGSLYLALSFSADVQEGENVSDEASKVVWALSAAGISIAMFDDMVASKKTAGLDELVESTLPDHLAVLRDWHLQRAGEGGQEW